MHPQTGSHVSPVPPTRTEFSGGTGVLEGLLPVLLVNARHIRNVIGQKTDVKDCDWITQMLQHALLRAIIVPDRPQRELRDLTRRRSLLVAEQTRVTNGIHKRLEDAHVKLGSVAWDILGVCGQDMIQGLIGGQDDPDQLAKLACGRLREKLPALQGLLRGHLTAHHRFMLGQLMDHLRYLGRQIRQFDQRIEELMSPFQEAINRLTTIPGVGVRTAQNLLSEIGAEMSRFQTGQHRASWASMCPGNRERAGTRQSGRTNHGNRWLRATLVQAAWTPSHSKKTCISVQYRRLVGQRGKKRAIVAVGHMTLVVMYHMPRDGANYQELGTDYLDKLQRQRLTRYLVKRLESLGHVVTLNPVDRAS